MSVQSSQNMQLLMYFHFHDIHNHHISLDIEAPVETKPRDLRVGRLPNPQNPGRDGWAADHQIQVHQIRHKVKICLMVSDWTALESLSRVTVEISCQMDFTQYPFDQHVCTFQVGSCESNQQTNYQKHQRPATSCYHCRFLRHQLDDLQL